MLPAAYVWLDKEPAPKMLVEAVNLYGTKEAPGSANNPVIIGWAHEVHTTYPGDSVAWCGLFQSLVAKRAGWDYHPQGNALWAKNWATWGTPQKTAMLGDVLVFTRDGGGHVGQYVGEDETSYHVLGGNESDMVNIVRIAKSRCIAIRRAPWKISQPDNVRKIVLKPTGAISTNEA